MVEITVGRSGELQGAEADIVQSLTNRETDECESATGLSNTDSAVAQSWARSLCLLIALTSLSMTITSSAFSTSWCTDRVAL